MATNTRHATVYSVAMSNKTLSMGVALVLLAPNILIVALTSIAPKDFTAMAWNTRNATFCQIAIFIRILSMGSALLKCVHRRHVCTVVAIPMKTRMEIGALSRTKLVKDLGGVTAVQT